MPELLERNDVEWVAPGAPLPGIDVGTGAEPDARDDLRRQIGRLERRLGELFASSFPRQGIEWRVGALGGPRVLSIGELERVRDALASRLRDAQAELARRADAEEANRGLLESMICEPELYPWVRISNEDVGEAGCRHWHSRPRWGILGMLFGWWRVKLSSGCPLAKGRRGPCKPSHLDLLARSSRSRRFELRSLRRSDCVGRPGRFSGPSVSKKRRKRRPRGAAAPQPAAPKPKRGDGGSARRSVDDERPQAPWGSFPLVEIVVLVALVMLVIGFVVGGTRGATLLGTGLVLGSLAGLELSVREHFAGYRSHTVLLSAAAALALLLALYYLAGLTPGASLAVGAVGFGLGAWALTRAFRARSGGRAFKLR
ncbi:MAG: hypothetical protein ACRDK9_14455 [Solirubrobacterales bacterium]